MVVRLHDLKTTLLQQGQDRVDLPKEEGNKGPIHPEQISKSARAWCIFAKVTGLELPRDPVEALQKSQQTLELRAEASTLRRKRGSPQAKEAIRGHGSMESAWLATIASIGDLGPDQVEAKARLGSAKGLVNGYQSADGKKGWRLDFDPNRGAHFNWYDWTEGKAGDGGRWGAESFPKGENEYIDMVLALQDDL